MYYHTKNKGTMPLTNTPCIPLYGRHFSPTASLFRQDHGMLDIIWEICPSQSPPTCSKPSSSIIGLRDLGDLLASFQVPCVLGEPLCLRLSNSRLPSLLQLPRGQQFSTGLWYPCHCQGCHWDNATTWHWATEGEPDTQLVEHISPEEETGSGQSGRRS